MTPAPQISQPILGRAPFRPIPPRVARTRQQKTMIATIALAGIITAQGHDAQVSVVQGHDDGRLTIADGIRHLTGWPASRVVRGTLSAIVLAVIQERPDPLLGRAWISHHLRTERYRRRAAGLGKRGSSGAEGTG